MIKSMTGFGRGKLTSEGRDYTVEIRTVNHCLEGLLSEGHDGISSIGHLQCRISPALTQQSHICTGHNAAFGIDDTEHTLGHILQLNHYTLEYTVGHF